MPTALIIGSADRMKGPKMGKEDVFGGDEGEGKSREADLFASMREAFKSGDDEGGAKAFKELVACCSGEDDEDDSMMEKE